MNILSEYKLLQYSLDGLVSWVQVRTVYWSVIWLNKVGNKHLSSLIYIFQAKCSTDVIRFVVFS